MIRAINFLRLMELLGKGVRFFTPWIGRIIIFMVSFMLTLLITFWGGVPTRCAQVADLWLDRAAADGFPTIWSARLYWTFYFLAFAMLIVGWVILSFITVWLVHLIFR